MNSSTQLLIMSMSVGFAAILTKDIEMWGFLLGCQVFLLVLMWVVIKIEEKER